jgi:L-asparaginase II
MLVRERRLDRSDAGDSLGRRGSELQGAAHMQVLVEVERSGFVESRHFGVAVVVDADGAPLATVGDPDEPVYLRSSAKPFQALAVRGLGVEAGLGLDEVALAGACGSHQGEAAHVASVRIVLAAAGLDESALRCPPSLPGSREARTRVSEPASVYHNCSGKHAYMLAGSVVRGWETGRYTAPEHPLQALVTETLADFAGARVEHVGVDGCGVPVHAMPLRGLALAYARLGALAARGEDGPAALVAAVRRHPQMICGTGQLDTVMLQATGGRVLSKVGAEAVYGAVDLERNHGLALKVLDGSPRARGAALLAVVQALGWLGERELEAVLPAAVSEVRGGERPVGAVRPAKVVLTQG